MIRMTLAPFRSFAPQLVLAAALAWSPTALAQSATDKAAAEVLFNDGLEAMGKRDFQSACPKLEESLRLDRGVGVMLYLADCYEQSGRTASSWATYREAEALASERGDDRRQVAADSAQRLDRLLARLIIVVDEPARASGMEIRRGGTLVGAGQWGTAVPIDPGEYELVVTAPGKQTWTTRVTVPSSPGLTEVRVPVLAAEATPAPPAPKVPAPTTSAPPPPPANAVHPPSASRTWQRPLGVSAAAIGIVGIAVGGYFGLRARSKLDESNDGHCRSQNRCDAEGVDLRSQAGDAATLSNVTFAVGFASLAAGTVIYFTAPTQSSVGVAPVVTSRQAGLLIEGRF
jgi:hypothetical protein